MPYLDSMKSFLDKFSKLLIFSRERSKDGSMIILELLLFAFFDLLARFLIAKKLVGASCFNFLKLMLSESNLSFLVKLFLLTTTLDALLTVKLHF